MITATGETPPCSRPPMGSCSSTRRTPGGGQLILDKIRTVTDKPITTIINTHTHADHTGGNEFFGTSVEFVAHENTKANMEKMDNFKGDKSVFLPKKTYKDKLTLGGKDEIDLYYFGPAHTNGDACRVQRACSDARRRRVRGQGHAVRRRATAAAASSTARPWRRRRRRSRTSIHHHRPQHADEACRPEAVRRLQHRAGQLDSSSEEGRQDGRSSGRGSTRFRQSTPAIRSTRFWAA